ncbi:MAG: FAD-dependent oxidoreductase [Acidobacteria bacterium]|nr:FAD-dependent oxidoreductase [Acidobacteriota bacterium]
MTRRDFLNGVLIGSGAPLLGAARPSDAAWDGPGGVGDYRTSHGNSWKVLNTAHRIRDREFSAEELSAEDTAEVFDLVIVGGGMSGLGAALHFQQKRRPRHTCLILDNHAIFGGESKRNEFIVQGQRLMAPQGANEFNVPTDPASDGYEIFEQLKIPRRFEYQTSPEDLRELEFDRTNYGFQHWLHAPSFGHHVDGNWVRDFWKKHASESLRSWKYANRKYSDEEDYRPWLDTMTYKAYIENVMGLPSSVTRFADPILAAAMGLGCDALSAYAAHQVGLPGFAGLSGKASFPIEFADVPETEWHMFPGGNTGLARYIVKQLVPESIPGGRSLDTVINGRINFRALDRPRNSFRLRLSSTVVRVGQTEKHATVTYLKDGRLRQVRAHGVVMACGSWVSKHIVQDLTPEKRTAFQSFHHSSVLVFNVAVKHWRFLYDLGITSARWTGGFGFSCNVRRQMITPRYRPPFSPDSPNVITFYVPLFYPGLAAAEQGFKGRQEMLSTPFAGYEEQIRDQLQSLFGPSAVKAIAGIILNRWGHAYVNPAPGFYFGRGNKPAPPDVIRAPLGRVTFAHSELNGHQFWLGAMREGRRAVDQLQKL